MQTAPIPENEAERLAALYALDILDTPNEDRFDRITRLATSLFQVPIAYIAFVDEGRQWFKSACGLSATETGRDVAFCAHTILHNEFLIIPDALADARFADNPLVTGEPYVRFYAGYPLSTPQGYNVGTLCLVDQQPRELAPDERHLLADLGHALEDQLTLVDVIALQKDLLEAKHRIEQANQALESRNRFIREVFGRYLTDEVANALLASPEALKLGGERRTITILMSDLRGFTPLSQELAPEKVVQILNIYLGKMIEIITKYGGTIDEIIGDAILVLFGAPLSAEDDTERTLACALEMQAAIGEVNTINAGENLPPLEMGIGIHTGEVVVGNIGSEKRMKYSVVGDTVNLTARIESFTVGGQILISASTRHVLQGKVRIDGQLRVKMKGMDEPVTIYEVGGLEGYPNLDRPLPAE